MQDMMALYIHCSPWLFQGSFTDCSTSALLEHSRRAIKFSPANFKRQSLYLLRVNQLSQFQMKDIKKHNVPAAVAIHDDLHIFDTTKNQQFLSMKYILVYGLLILQQISTRSSAAAMEYCDVCCRNVLSSVSTFSS